MERFELPQGTLDLLVLRVLASGPMHGWGIAQRLGALSDKVLQLKEGTLYPALYRMEAKGWIKAEWSQSENNRRAKFYRLTAIGQKRLAAEKLDWTRLSGVVEAVLRGA